MREKAEILVDLEKLQRVRDELTDEVTNLHAQLEQERSKVHSLTSTDGKGKGVSVTHRTLQVRTTIMVILWSYFNRARRELPVKLILNAG